MTAARYAIYFAPDSEDPLWRFGCGVLGYDAASGRESASPPPDGVDERDWASLIASPRRYGFHATLKAPFAPAPGLDEATVCAALDVFAARHRPFEAPPLRTVLHHGYVTLVPDTACEPLDRFAEACVRELDHLRAPHSETDLARRLEAPLSARQRGHLARFGYPYVLEDFQFHMTLAGPCAPQTAETVRTALAARFAAEVPAGPFAVAGVALFAEPARGAPFRLVHKAALGGPRA